MTTRNKNQPLNRGGPRPTGDRGIQNEPLAPLAAPSPPRPVTLTRPQAPPPPSGPPRPNGRNPFSAVGDGPIIEQ